MVVEVRRMISENLKPLAQEYPELFENVYCGASIGDGWVHLVREACEKMNGRPVRIVQIKEKFGMLRIYFHRDEGVDYEEVKDIQELLNNLEDRSRYMCERCGGPAELDTTFCWVKTLCPCHANERIKEMEEYNKRFKQ